MPTSGLMNPRVMDEIVTHYKACHEPIVAKDVSYLGSVLIDKAFTSGDYFITDVLIHVYYYLHGEPPIAYVRGVMPPGGGQREPGYTATDEEPYYWISFQLHSVLPDVELLEAGDVMRGKNVAYMGCCSVIRDLRAISMPPDYTRCRLEL